jgi:putative phosphoserine phosphatase/1-acylglycerol-3-phosphate O-acyltransferase
MATLAELVASVYTGPRGAEIAACFDYDGTVIGGYSAQAFYNHRMRALEIGPVELARTLLAGARGIRSDEDFAAFLEVSLAAWKDVEESELEELGERLFRNDIARRLHTEVWELLEAHRRMGHTLVLASSATRFQVEPMARELGVDHALFTPVEVLAGRLTGRTAGPPLWGGGKACALRALAAEHDLDLERSCAYSNGDEDVPFLEAVGHPVAVEPTSALRAEAQRRGWPVLRCASRRGRPGVLETARTVGFYGSFATAFGAGLGLGLLNRSRQTLVDITGGVGADIGLALAGVDVAVVRGQQHAWSSRPCVFVFNHQSNIDPIVIMKVLRSGFTGVAKAEVKRIPGFGQFFQIAGVAFVERGNTAQARKALEPAVAKIRDERLSLVIAPEGTRSVTPRVGRFKKGAFHIAIQAEVPMVPIVLRHAGAVMPRGAHTIREGRIEVVVMPPVMTSGWTVETLDDHVAEVRGMIADTLDRWPGMPALPERATGAAMS